MALTLTPDQKYALYRLYLRYMQSDEVAEEEYAMSYLSFRRTVKPYLDGSGCIMVPLFGFWFGIEPDGYTHT